MVGVNPIIGRTKMKNGAMTHTKISVALSLAVAVLTSPAYACTPTPNSLCNTGGMLVAVYADPSDVVAELDTPGDCGTKYFHIQRSQTNFKEVAATILTAFSTTKRMNLFIQGCRGTPPNARNILSHGGVVN
jgi:hypothetical protein